MKTSTATIKFRIDIDFEEADVDMVYEEARAAGFQGMVPSILVDYEAEGGFGRKAKKFKLKQGSKTPTADSVNFCLNWLAGFVDRRNMCITKYKWDKDYGADDITVTRADGRTHSDKPEVLTELEEIGIDVESWYGLMMGTCHLVCVVDAALFSPELVQKANAIVHGVFKKYVRYYKTKKQAA